MPSQVFHLLSLMALFSASSSMLAEPVIELLVDAPVHRCADTDSDSDDNDDDSEDGEFLLTNSAILDDPFASGCRVTLLSDVATASRNLAGDPRGPPVFCNQNDRIQRASA